MSGDVLLVLGASSDIGLALLRALPHDYGRILAHAHQSQDRLKALARERTDLSIDIFTADLADLTQTNHLMAAMTGLQLVPTRIVHLPAPPFAYRRLRELTWDMIQKEIDVQVRSLFLLFKTFLPAMAQQKRGKVAVVLSDVTMEMPPPYLTHYVTAKQALLGLVRSAAAEFGGQNLSINALSPGMVETRFVAELPESLREAQAQRMPAGRLLQPADVAQAILNVFSEAAGPRSGANLPVTPRPDSSE